MPHQGLAEFLEELGHAGELARVGAEVDPCLEVAEVTRRLAVAGGPAVLFARPTSSDTPVLANLLGTEDRIARALGQPSVDDVAARFAALVESGRPEGWLEMLGGPARQGPLAGFPPRKVRNGPVQQVVRLGRDLRLGELPLLRSAVEEIAPALTAATLLTVDPADDGRRAVRCDLPLLGPDRLAACWLPSDEPARLLHEYRRLGERMPVAAVLGGDPALALAATDVLPERIDPLAAAGLLRNKPLDVVRCRSVELDVPAAAEIVVEGFVDPAEPPVDTGPRCGPLGLCCPAGPAPVIQVTAITHRANPVFPAMVPGRPPHEACVIRRAMALIFVPLLKLAIPELIDFDLPLHGGARHLAFLAIRKTYAGQARRVAMAAWSQRAFQFARLLVVVDEDVDVHNPEAVMAAAAAHAAPARDVFTQTGPADPLDPAATPGELAQRTGIDATVKLPGERHGAVAAPGGKPADDIRRRVTDRWAEYGLGPEGPTEQQP